MEWYLKVVRDNYANFEGRARRTEYWMFAVFNVLFVIGIVIVDYIVGSFPILYAIYLLAMIIPSLAVGIRRLHDIDKSGWWNLIVFVPVIGGIWLLVLFCLDGTPGDNGYGPSPKAATL